MNVKQAIQSSANVIRVTSISVGDVYKRFEDGYDDRVYYGVVRNVHNDGERAIVEAVEYRKTYDDIDVSVKIIRGEKDYTLFPAEPEALNVELQGVVDKKKRNITQKQSEIAKLEIEIAECERLISGETLKDLKTMSYKELSQPGYEAKKLEAGI